MGTELEDVRIAGNFLTSHGGTELQARWNTTLETLDKTAHLHDIWDRSNSEWSLTNLTLKMGAHTPLRQLRQISAELERREMALSEAKFSILRKQAEIEAFQVRVQDETLSTLELTMLRLDIAERHEQISFTLRKFSGAMKDVATLKAAYDALIEVHGLPTIEEIEAEERHSYLVRAIIQSLRDIRQTGTVNGGNQELFEQCGISPCFAMRALKQFAGIEGKYETSNVALIYDFANDFAKELCAVKGLQAPPV
jgi:S-adenosylmethionine synthetase